MTGPSERIAGFRRRDVQVTDRTLWRHVVLETGTGLTGTGELTLQKAGPGFGARLEQAARHLVGRDLFDDPLRPIAAMAGQDLEARTLHAALDQAVCDLRARAEGVPLWRHLNPDAAAGPIPLYANINRTTRDRAPAGFAANAARAAAEGYGAIKIAPFDGLSPDLCGTEEGDAIVAAGLDRLRAVAGAAPGCAVQVDCHWRFTPRAALDLIPALREIGVTWYECPIPETAAMISDLGALRRAANAADMRLAGLETAGGWDDLRPFVEGGAYDVVMPDVKHVGSLRAILEIGQRAAAAGVAVSLHNPSGPVAHLVSVHVMTALGSAERMEVQWNESPLFFDVADPGPVLSGGRCTATDAPGLGARLNPAVPQAASGDD